MYHIFFKLFDSQDLWPHLTWPHLTSFLSKVVWLLVRVFMVKISLNFNKICFMPYSTKQTKNRPPRKKKPKAVKDRGGVEGRYDRGQRFNGFFLKASLRTKTKVYVSTYFIIIWSWSLHGTLTDAQRSSISRSIFNTTRRYGSLRGPTSSSCGGLWPWLRAFFCPLGKKDPIIIFWPILGHPWCQVVITFISDLINIKK